DPRASAGQTDGGPDGCQRRRGRPLEGDRWDDSGSGITTMRTTNGFGPRRHRGLLGLALPLAALCLMAPAARAQSRTAESIWSQNDAEQRAIDQVPVSDRGSITDTRCQEVGVGRMGSLPRFRCTVWFTPAPAAPATPSATPTPGTP
ncbi:MAG: hypothetical protein ACKOPT_17020, partial [Cyanobium sp.]